MGAIPTEGAEIIEEFMDNNLRMLIASYKSRFKRDGTFIGFVVETDHWGVLSEFEEVGRFTDDLGMTAPPGPGLWIWEGKFDVTPHPYDDLEFTGEYRRLTEFEAFLARNCRVLDEVKYPEGSEPDASVL